MKKKLTVIIISYNRHDELKKKIRFWQHNSNKYIQIIIIDGSKNSLNLKKNSNIEYIHYPTESYHRRLSLSRKYIKTEFCKLENDDDYSDPKILLKIVNKLKNESYSDYVAGYGSSAIYSKYNNEIFIKTLFDQDKFKLTCDNSINIRLKNTFYERPYSPAIYFSVMRSSLFIKILKIFHYLKKSYGDNLQLIAEIAIVSSIVVAGRVLFVNDLFWIRNDSPITKRVEFKNIKKIIGAKSHSYLLLSKRIYQMQVKEKFLDKFYNILFKVLEPDLKKKNFNKIINQTMLLYYQKSILKHIHKKNYFSYIKKILIFIPSKIKKKIRFLFRINGPSVKDLVSKKFKGNLSIDNAFLIKFQKNMIYYKN